MNDLTGLLGTFLDAIFGRQLTTGALPQGEQEQLSFCLLRLLDEDKTRCRWQEAYRRRDGVIGAAHWLITTRAYAGHLFFVPNGFEGNGRQGDWLKRPKGKARFRNPDFHFGKAHLVTLNAVSLDWDEGLVGDEMLSMHDRCPEAFLEAAGRSFTEALGVDAYLVVKTRPGYGYQPHLLIEPCEASEENLALWKRVSQGAQVMYEAWGADPAAAGRAVQPYRLPGCQRPDFPGWETELVAHRQGRRIPLQELAAALDRLGFLPPEKPAQLPASFDGSRLSPERLQGPTLGSMIESGKITRGFVKIPNTPSRNWGLFCLWRALHTEGYSDEACDDRVATVNRLSVPGPIADDELHKTVMSARNYRWPVSQEVWGHVCDALGVDLAHPGSRARGGASTPRNAKYFHQQITRAGEALDAFLSRVGGAWKGPFAGLLSAMDLPARAGRALRAAISERVARGKIGRGSRPGRNGYIQLLVVDPTSEKSCIVNTAGGDGWVDIPSELGNTKRIRNEVPAGGVDGQLEGASGKVGRLLGLCRSLFGVDLVVDMDAAEAAKKLVSKRAADPDRRRKEMRRELQKSVGDVGLLAGLVRLVTRRERMALVLEVAAGLALAGVSPEHARLLGSLGDKLQMAQRRLDARREEAAWISLQWGRITAEDLRWLVERQSGRKGEYKALERLVMLAERWWLDRGSGAHADVLCEARRRLQVLRPPRTARGAGTVRPGRAQLTFRV